MHHACPCHSPSPLHYMHACRCMLSLHTIYPLSTQIWRERDAQISRHIFASRSSFRKIFILFLCTNIRQSFRLRSKRSYTCSYVLGLGEIQRRNKLMAPFKKVGVQRHRHLHHAILSYTMTKDFVASNPRQNDSRVSIQYL
jgi:hypothetical protein